MAVETLFTDPDGDGIGEWSVDTTTTVDLTAVIAYIDDRIASVINSPKFLGVPEAPTAAPAANSKQIANTEYVDTAVAAGQVTAQDFVEAAIDNAALDELAPLDGAVLTNATATTPAAGNNTTSIATTAFVRANVLQFAQLLPGYSHTVNEIAGGYTRGTARADIVVRFRGFTDPKVTADSWLVGDEWLRPE